MTAGRRMPAASSQYPPQWLDSSGRRLAGGTRPKPRDRRARPAAGRPRAGTLDESDTGQRRHNGRISGDRSWPGPNFTIESIRELVAAMQSDEVTALVILGGNPVYDAPADLKFAASAAQGAVFSALESIRRRNVSGLPVACSGTHLLESWSDTRGRRRHGSDRAAAHCAAVRRQDSARITGRDCSASRKCLRYEIVRDYWQQRHGDASSAADAISTTGGKRRCMTESSPDTASPSSTPSASCGLCGGNWRPSSASVVAAQPSDSADIVFRPDPSVWDGRFANNGWLQELPRPFTKLTWDNAALISPHLAERA